MVRTRNVALGIVGILHVAGCSSPEMFYMPPVYPARNVFSSPVNLATRSNDVRKSGVVEGAYSGKNVFGEHEPVVFVGPEVIRSPGPVIFQVARQGADGSQKIVYLSEFADAQGARAIPFEQGFESGMYTASWRSDANEEILETRCIVVRK